MCTMFTLSASFCLNAAGSGIRRSFFLAFEPTRFQFKLGYSIFCEVFYYFLLSIFNVYIRFTNFERLRVMNRCVECLCTVFCLKKERQR